MEHTIPYDDYDLPSDAAYFESPNVQGPHQDLSEGLPPSSASPIGRSGDSQYNEYQAGQDELLATPEVGTSSAYTPPSSDAAESWTPAPTKRRRSSTKRPPASPPRESSQGPKKPKDSAFSSPMDVEDLVSQLPIKVEDKAAPPPSSDAHQVYELLPT